jgi:hypothetical protein
LASKLLVARKNQFLSKEDQEFEFHSKWEFGLIFKFGQQAPCCQEKSISIKRGSGI